MILVNGFVNGNAGADAITSQVNNGTVFGGQGNDTLNTFFVSSASRVNANAGNDTVNAGAVISSSVFGGQGNDSVNLTGNVGDSTVQGDLGNDTINLGGGISATSSVINGNAGNDNIANAAALTSLAGSSIFGGQGSDTINFATAATSAFLSGDDGNDSLAGTTAADTINGGDGIDTITTGTGNNIANGGAGGDIMTDGTGNDTITGGTGADQITLTGGTDRVVQNVGDSVAATTSWTAVGAGNALTSGVVGTGSALAFANGVDVLTGFAAGDQFATAAAGAQAYGAAGFTDITTLAPGQYIIRGTWTAATSTFTYLTTGLDSLFLNTTGNLTAAANNGTTSTVIVGYNLVTGDVVAA